MIELESLASLDGETPKAYQAFCDYVDLGYDRSFAKLMQHYQTQTEAAPTRILSTVKAWSKKYAWQNRVKAYQRELATAKQSDRVEAFSNHMDKALPMAAGLLAKAEEMLTDFQRLRTTRRQLVDDPRDAHLAKADRRQIESIQTKVNTNDLQKLVQTFGTLNRDLRTSLGLPDVKEIQGLGETVIKTYVTVSPDDWDNNPAPAIPETIHQDDAPDPIENFDEDYVG